MKFSIPLLATVALAAAECSVENNVYYCLPTKKVVFTNVGFSGSYNKVTLMNSQLGQCSLQPYSFLGTLAPVDEELSVHFRGPINVKQFGVYYPSLGAQQQKREEDCQTRHVHHKHKRATTEVVITRTIIVDGQQTPVAATETFNEDENLAGVQKAYRPDILTKSAPTTTLAGPQPSAAQAGDWTRVSYYQPGTGNNVTFLNHFGGQGSGVWDSVFGNSLSYCNHDASGGLLSPVVLDDVTIGSNKEYMIMSGEKCDELCGYCRDGTVAYKGWAGTEKIFVFEFLMPHEGDKNSFNGDMPAVWMLNAQIPSTLQYGKKECSCWSTGCGELDLFEVLLGGSDKMIAHLHTSQGAPAGTNYGGGGSQDYFNRPTDGTMKAAVIFHDDQIHIQQLDDSTTFGDNLSADTVNQWLAQAGSQAAIGY